MSALDRDRDRDWDHDRDRARARKPTSSRRELLGAAGAAAGIAAAGSLLLSAPPAGAEAERRADASRLERLMSIELLALFVYDHVLESGYVSGAERRLLNVPRGQDQQHVIALRRIVNTAGVAPARAPMSVAEANGDLGRRQISGRLGQLQGRPDALNLLLDVERVAIGAYFVALRKLRGPSSIVLAAQIMANDAQHEAIIAEQLHPGRLEAAAPYGLVQGIQ